MPETPTTPLAQMSPERLWSELNAIMQSSGLAALHALIQRATREAQGEAVTPPDPQGAGTRVETMVEWRNVYRDEDGNRVSGFTHISREQADQSALWSHVSRIAVEEVTTVTTITRYPIPPHAGEETKG